MDANMLTKGLDDTLFSAADTRFFPSYYGVKAVPQLPSKCNGMLKRRNGCGLEAMARYDIGTRGGGVGRE
jgi:hypothetical protein